MTELFNDTPDPAGGDNSRRASEAEMATFIQRVERLEDERSQITADITDVYAEAKAKGYDVKALRKIVGLRKLKVEDRQMLKFYGDILRIFE